MGTVSCVMGLTSSLPFPLRTWSSIVNIGAFIYSASCKFTKPDREHRICKEYDFPRFMLFCLWKQRLHGPVLKQSELLNLDRGCSSPGRSPLLRDLTRRYFQGGRRHSWEPHAHPPWATSISLP